MSRDSGLTIDRVVRKEIRYRRGSPHERGQLGSEMSRAIRLRAETRAWVAVDDIVTITSVNGLYASTYRATAAFPGVKYPG